ncbi:MAG: FGGY family carbohydrate kinase [Candidatus Limnocylindrales bacterium]
MITLGVDVGTTHTKVLALDVEAGRTLALESAATPVVRDAAGEAHRPTEVLRTVQQLLAAVVDRLPAGARPAALCVASVGEEVVLLDPAGAPLGDAIAWYDPRGLDEAAAFMAGPGGALPLSCRWPPDATFSLFKLLWIREHDPHAAAAAATWTDLGDFVLKGLGADVVMDWTHASRAGAFDIARREWDPATIDAVGLELAFPRLVPSRTVIGTLDPELARGCGLTGEVALVSGGHDHLCGAYGAGVRTTRELFLSAGTSEAHLSLLEAPLEGDAARGVDQGCYVDEDTWYAHINIHSGHFFQQWRGLLFPGVDDESMYEAVAAADAAGMTFTVTDDLRLGRLDAVAYDADAASIMRAVLEGLAQRSATIVERLEAAAGSPYELILAAGHPALVPFWRELRARAYERPMARVTERETTAFGAAVMAAHALQGDSPTRVVAGRERWR